MVNRSPYVTGPARSPARMLPVLTNARPVWANHRCESATRSPAGDSPAGVAPPSRCDGMGAAAVWAARWVTGFVAVAAASTMAATRASCGTATRDGSVVLGGWKAQVGRTEPQLALIVA